MNNLSMPTQEEGWLTKKVSEMPVEESLISPEECVIALKNIKDSLIGVTLDVTVLHQKTKTKELYDVLIHLNESYKSLIQII